MWKKTSPQMSVRSASRQNETWPGLWPGVSSTTNPWPSSSPSRSSRSGSTFGDPATGPNSDGDPVARRDRGLAAAQVRRVGRADPDGHAERLVDVLRAAGVVVVHVRQRVRAGRRGPAAPRRASSRTARYPASTRMSPTRYALTPLRGTSGICQTSSATWFIGRTLVCRPCPRTPSSPSAATASCSSRSTAPTRATRSTARWPRASPPRSTSSTPTTTCAVGVLTGAGKGFCAGMDLKAFVAGERPWDVEPRVRRHRPAAAAQAAHRRDRGLRRGRRARGRARVRPDRRGGGRQARHPGGQALARRRRRRAAAPAAADALPTSRWSWRSPATRSPPSAAYELGLVNRVAEPARRVDAALELAGGDRAQRPARASPRRRRSSHAAVRLGRGGVLAAAGRDLRPGLRSPRTRARARSRSPRSATRSGRAASAARPRASRRPSARRRGRGARRGRCPARCRARAGRRAPGSVSAGPSSDALTCAGMSSAPSSVWVQGEASPGRRRRTRSRSRGARRARRSR